MDEQVLECPKCGGAMERGFMMMGGERFDLPEWVKGVMELNFIGNIKLRGKERYRVMMFRCPYCYYIELYAKHPVR
jgi:predicted nucleic-acid-binding Zn-ribbon protein